MRGVFGKFLFVLSASVFNMQSLFAQDVCCAASFTDKCVILPDYCPTPDGMAISPNGDLVVACPNFADRTKPACLIKISKDWSVKKWVDVPVLAKTGFSAPMGIAFDNKGNLIVCDNQGWGGEDNSQKEGRLLRLKFDGDNFLGYDIIAYGMEHPNGVRVRDGKIYVTQSILSDIKDDSGLIVSGVYCFNINDKNIKVTNTKADKNLICTVVTKNKEVQYGLDGLVFDDKGNLYVGNFGDGAIHKIIFNKKGVVESADVWAQDLKQMRTTDGITIDGKGNIIVADFSENAVAVIDTEGTVKRIAQSPDCDGSDGSLDQPGEPILWNGKLVVSCFDIVTGPDKVNTGHDEPFTLAILEYNY